MVRMVHVKQRWGFSYEILCDKLACVCRQQEACRLVDVSRTRVVPGGQAAVALRGINHNTYIGKMALCKADQQVR